MKKYFSIAVVYPSLVVFIVMILGGIISAGLTSGPVNLSESFLFVIATAIGAVGIYAAFFALMCAPIYYYNVLGVKKSRLGTLVSWFLMPGAFLVYQVIEIITKWQQLQEPPAMELTLTLPYIAGLIISFIMFSRKQKILLSTIPE